MISIQFKILLFLLMILVIPFGGNRVFAWSLFTILVIVLMLTLRGRPYVTDAFHTPMKVLMFSLIVIPICYVPLYYMGLGTSVLDVNAHVYGIQNITAFVASYLVAFYGVQKRRSIVWVLVGVTVIGILDTFLGVLGWLVTDGVIYKPYDTIRYLKGTFANFNHYGSFLLLAISALLALIVKFYKLYPAIVKYVGGALLVLFMMALVSTGSRGAMVTFVVFLSMLGWLFRKELMSDTIKQYTVLSVLIAGIAVLLLVFPDTLDRLVAMSGKSSRIFTYFLAMDIVREHWLFGIGFGGFDALSDSYKYINMLPYHIKYVHNTPLQIIVELGVVGFIMYLLFVMSWIKTVWRPLNKMKSSHPEYLVFFVGILAVLLHSFIEFNIYIPAIYVLISIGMACMHKLVIIHQKRSEC